MTQEVAVKKRKNSINKNKFGSVRNVNGKVYVDFSYLGERVREQSNYVWSDENAKNVRDQLDRIDVAIKDGSFRFSTVFPNSKHIAKFDQLERDQLNRKPEPDQVRIGEYLGQWLEEKANSGHVEGRTVGYNDSIIRNHIKPYFADRYFSEITAAEINRFYAWSRDRKVIRKLKPLSNNHLIKIVNVLKAICKDAAIEYGWKADYNPFFGFKNLPKDDNRDDIKPFTLSEQKKILSQIPEHWKPFVKFAFVSGIRQGEQLALKPEDIDWQKRTLTIKSAITKDKDGHKVEGPTKNRYSRRTINLIPSMYDALFKQKAIHDKIGGKYFFITPTGKGIDASNFFKRVWIPALESAGVEYRPMKQTRHSFVTLALSKGENPLWISKVVGHRDTEMVFKVYSRFVENINGQDGSKLSDAFQDNVDDNDD
ncbi:site-specific integrase [bacterium]|nr:site-specific integrase [bacterium]